MCFPILGAAMLGYGSTAAATAATGITATGLGVMAGTTALGVASPLVSAAGQRQQAKAQMAFQAQQQRAAQKKIGYQQTAALLEQDQQAEALNEQRRLIALKSQALKDRADVIMAERGAGGRVRQAVLGEYDRELGEHQTKLNRQQELYSMQYGLGLQQLGLQHQQEMLALSQPVDVQSPLVTGIQALSGGLQGAGAGLTLAQAGRRRIPQTQTITG